MDSENITAAKSAYAVLNIVTYFHATTETYRTRHVSALAGARSRKRTILPIYDVLADEGIFYLPLRVLDYRFVLFVY